MRALIRHTTCLLFLALGERENGLIRWRQHACGNTNAIHTKRACAVLAYHGLAVPLSLMKPTSAHMPCGPATAECSTGAWLAPEQQQQWWHHTTLVRRGGNQACNSVGLSTNASEKFLTAQYAMQGSYAFSTSNPKCFVPSTITKIVEAPWNIASACAPANASNPGCAQQLLTMALLGNYEFELVRGHDGASYIAREEGPWPLSLTGSQLQAGTKCRLRFSRNTNFVDVPGGGNGYVGVDCHNNATIPIGSVANATDVTATLTGMRSQGFGPAPAIIPCKYTPGSWDRAAGGRCAMPCISYRASDEMYWVNTPGGFCGCLAQNRTWIENSSRNHTAMPATLWDETNGAWADNSGDPLDASGDAPDMLPVNNADLSDSSAVHYHLYHSFFKHSDTTGEPNCGGRGVCLCQEIITSILRISISIRRIDLILITITVRW